MQKLLIAGLFLLLALFSTLAVAETENDCLYYFYGKDCERCNEVDTYLDQLSITYPQLNIQKYEVYFNVENLNTLQNYFNVYHVPSASQGVPVVFISESYFSGKEPILTLLEERILENQDSSCPSLTPAKVVGLVGSKSPKDVLETFTFARITGSALADSLSPVVFLLLLILIPLLSAVKDQEVLQRGIVFIIGVCIAVFLFGLGLFTWFIDHQMVSNFALKIVGLAAMVYGVIGIKRFFAARYKGFEPEKSRFFLSPQAVFIIGFLASLFILTSLGDTFIALRVLIADPGMRLVLLPLLLYYVVIFCWFLLVIVLIFYIIRMKLIASAVSKKKDLIKEIEIWKRHHLRVFRFVVYVLMFILGLVMLFI